MGLLKQIFTWWDGATLTTALHVRRHGRQVGTDEHGNAYYASKKGDRRWVIYKGENDASRVPPEWFSWLHRLIDDVPEKALPPTPKFLKEPEPNLTGTPQAYKPAGALERGGRRAAASGDYEAWTPDQA
jgi:NADH:ubiquinone oxidoreductase subunit